jgi:hypothetical protein
MTVDRRPLLFLRNLRQGERCDHARRTIKSIALSTPAILAVENDVA